MTWKYFGFHLVLYVAGLQQIPSEIEDAARIDGATNWQVLRGITRHCSGARSASARSYRSSAHSSISI
jgi:Binding-protein-dependent transport system inner membrane component